MGQGPKAAGRVGSAPQPGSRERWAMHSAFTSFLQSGRPMIPLTLIVGLLIPVNPIEKIPPSRAQSFVSMVILSLIKFTIKI